jgi:hypothetical protein
MQECRTDAKPTLLLELIRDEVPMKSDAPKWIFVSGPALLSRILSDLLLRSKSSIQKMAPDTTSH